MTEEEAIEKSVDLLRYYINLDKEVEIIIDKSRGILIIKQFIN